MATSVLITALWMGMIFLMIGRMLRNFAGLFWPQLIASGAGITLLWSSAIRVTMDTTGGAYWAYGFFAVCAICGISFSVPALVQYAWHQRSVLLPGILHPLFITVVTLTAAVGVILRFPLIIATAEFAMTLLILATAITLLVSIGNIEPPGTRTRAALVGYGAVLLGISELVRIHFWHLSLDPFGVSLPPYGLLVFMSLVIVGLFIRGLRHLKISVDNSCREIDPVYVAEYGISPRELDIIRLICEGESNDMIAARLFISVSTVKNHIYHIYRKTGCHSRIEMINKLAAGRE